MRVPLSQVADMATYIAKNKIRPKPEWQKNLAPVDDSSNPFKIVHAQIPSLHAKGDRKSGGRLAIVNGRRSVNGELALVTA